MRMTTMLGVTICSAVLTATPLQAFDVVQDPWNLVQTTLTAVQTLRQLEVLIQNSTPIAGVWDTDAAGRLAQLAALVRQGEALAYSLQNLDATFREKHPGYVPSTNYHQDYARWVQTVLDTLRTTLNAAQYQSMDFAAEEARVAAATTKSETAVGHMQALQAGNMLAAETVQHLVQLRQLLMSQINAQNVFMAKQVNQEAQERAAVKQWLDTALTPLPPSQHRGFGPRDVPHP